MRVDYTPALVDFVFKTQIMRTVSFISRAGSGKYEGMKNNILLIEYEARSVERVRAALPEADYDLRVAADLDAAVEICAHFEPHAVITTSVLPNTALADAITQLRARAGLANTPFLILMSGYKGADPRGDAARYGAQDILERPFSGETLKQRLGRLLATAQDVAATQAVPREVLGAIQAQAAKEGGAPSLTSEDLFADILSDLSEPQKGGEPAVTGGAGEKAAPAAAGPEASSIDKKLEETLADVLGVGQEAKAEKAKKPDVEADVDKILSDTLAGLDITPPASAPTAKKEAKAEPAAAGGAPEIQGEKFGHYILLEHVATGGMAEVFKARMMGMEGFQKTVAIKRILPHLTDNDEFVNMFIDEAKLAAQLNHNNIIHIYDLGKIDRSYYIAMEYIEGWDLRSVLQRCREKSVVMPIRHALSIASLLAGALDYAHRKRDFENRELGLVHRDVSPQNVLISREGDIKLCDFGIAKAASKASHTRAGALKGKLQYMSPEQAWGREIDHRSDIFSLGLVLYEMLTGRRVFAGDSEMSVLEQVRNPQVAPPSTVNPDIPEKVDTIVVKALAADPADRYQSAKDMKQDLDKALRKLGGPPSPAELAPFLARVMEGQGPPAPPAAAAPGAAPGAHTPPAAPLHGVALPFAGDRHRSVRRPAARLRQPIFTSRVSRGAGDGPVGT